MEHIHSPRCLDLVQLSSSEPPAGSVQPTTSPYLLFSLSMPSSRVVVERTWVHSIPTLHASDPHRHSPVHLEKKLPLSLSVSSVRFDPTPILTTFGGNPSHDPLPRSPSAVLFHLGRRTRTGIFFGRSRTVLIGSFLWRPDRTSG